MACRPLTPAPRRRKWPRAAAPRLLASCRQLVSRRKMRLVPENGVGPLLRPVPWLARRPSPPPARWLSSPLHPSFRPRIEQRLPPQPLPRRLSLKRRHPGRYLPALCLSHRHPPRPSLPLRPARLPPLRSWCRARFGLPTQSLRILARKARCPLSPAAIRD